MRLLQVLVPEERRSETLRVLDDEGLDYVRTSECSDEVDAELVTLPVPTQAVDHVLTSLREVGIEEEFIIVSSIETARTPRIDELEERFVNGQEEDDSITREEIRTKALNMTPGRVTYYAMTLLSAIVATAGLLLDSPAIVVGSMVIAPQISAAMTGTVGLVLDDRRMFLDGVFSMVVGLVVAMVGAFGFAWLIRSGGVVPVAIDITAIEQVQNRISPGLLAIIVGVCAGAAGAFGLATAIPVSLVGVMIAAALIPAAAAVGIGVAWGNVGVALGAFVLVAVNVTSILLAGLAVLWYLGYRPEGWAAGAVRPNISRDNLETIAVVIAISAVVLSGAGIVLGQHVTFENEVNEEVRTVLDDDEYDELELVELQTEFHDGGTISDETEVTISIRRPADTAYPTLATVIERALEERTDRDVSVVLEFVEGATSAG
ncbi:TIGR00341 family protein [Natronococcus sp. JC468]|uniref:TIGR00341 family protein n=1 Tax=Natronococcus sp. JC468 TaxID=1961921 RepID=UPI00143BF79C|nr:TIGR00341 family protein [Natronococcus sp. JC468]NKE36494.1 TIGR00341 family protein [Natronococcus sp. JC468]